MEDRYLKYVLEVAKEQNMTRAAKNLYLTQPSLSQYIARLEDELGVPLFERSKGKLTPTEAGKLYVSFAEKVLDMQETLLDQICRLQDTRQLRISSTSTWSLRLLSVVLPEFSHKFPQIQIISQVGNLQAIENKLLSGEIDLALMATNSFDQYAGNGILLGMEEIFFAVPSSHPFCSSAIGKGDSISWNDLISFFDGEEFILPEKGSSVRNALEPLLARCWKSKFHCVMNHMETIWTMVAAKSGVAFIPRTCALTDPRIRFYSLEPKIQRYDTLICRKGLEMDASIQHFIELAQSYSLFLAQ